MNYLKIVCIILISFQLQAFSQDNPTDAGTRVDVPHQKIEENSIRSVVVNLYSKGLQIRDFSLIREICIPDAKLMGVNREGGLNVTTLDRWSKRFDPKNPPFKKLEYEILHIDRVGTAAQVKIQFLVDSKNFITDYLHMLKIKNEWKIVNIIDF